MKENKGITLVALIVTIIVLLILAGVTIAMLSGEDGVLNRAKQAKEIHEEAAEKELRRLTQMEASMNTENHDYYDKNKDKAVIPAGFAVSQVEGENTIADGLVIIDKNGNEFVWIPVNENNTFERRPGYAEGVLQDISRFAEVDETGTNSKVEENQEIKDEAIAMYSSVTTNGGFYIGRYEAGIESETPRENGDAITEDRVVVQKDKNVYNWLGWSDSRVMTDITGGAVELARNFAKEQGLDTTKVHSTLCYGVQRDTALNFIDPGYQGYAQDSTGKGNYYVSSFIKTGTNDNYKLKNIYDMAGNVYEWTMEVEDDNKRIRRGGGYTNKGWNVPASYRSSLYTTDKAASIGFRISIYL